MLLHGAVIGGAATVFWPSPPAPEPETIPIYFEVVEAAALDAAEQPVESEDGGRGATALPVPSGSVPTETAAVGRGQLALPVDAGSVPEDTRSVPEDTGPVPVEAAGSVPVNEEMKTRENEEVSDENLENEEVPDAQPEPAIEKKADDKEGEAPQSPSSAAASEEHAAVVSDPIALNRIVPVYPRSARRKGHEGVVTVAISVAEDGVVAHAEVVSSSGYRELDEAALSAVRSARFAPATSDGVSVRGELRLTFDFRLK